ncbi:MAG: glutathione S-transferase family protein [Gammaproteobacteria bacterium]
MKYVLYGDDLSLFTRKLDCACRFLGIDVERRPKTPNNASLIEQRAGTHQVPVLHTPENWMLADTTPIIALLDSRHPSRALFPPGWQGAIVHVLEEFFDEWVSRVMVHFRWHYPASAAFAAERMSDGDPVVANRLMDWGRRACRATGTEFPAQQQAAEAEYLALMKAADQQLRTTPFLLGARPTALDCCVLGGLRAHTLMDPDPRPRLAPLTTLLAWNAERADQLLPDPTSAPPIEITPFGHQVLTMMATTYRPFILANAAARKAGDKLFAAESYGESVTYLSRPYPEASRRMVSDRIAALDATSRATCRTLLGDYGILDCFW